MPDERLDEALEYADELVAARKPMPDTQPTRREFLAGWAEAIRALDEYHPLSEFGQDRSGDCSACDTQRAFIKAMRGGDDA